MADICPTVTAIDNNFDQQMELVGHFGHRVHIDLMDGRFAPTTSNSPESMWWPAGVKADIHIMYQVPETILNDVLAHLPHMIIIHAESDGDFRSIVTSCKQQGVKVGVALLPATPADAIFGALGFIDHVLVFSGNLGYQGGSKADMKLIKKAAVLKEKKPSIEIGWDGGVNDKNIKKLVDGGVDVVNVGGYIHNAESPSTAYETLHQLLALS